MEYIYCFPLISLANNLAPSLATLPQAKSSQPQTPTPTQRPSLNTSEALVRFC
ncbi:MAG: hypothetical protein SAJ12_01610 [Jaaginema sp. PMC 1079.18]|nr:hypothetical protein [Jaaginema sp. PMC 1080.18]MEC4849682.1 hypothetical protein [Jaaginema sp. PMC 1079.18]MEC4866165.1 hypothetical protein [Jaaginema sp. PMC 1078.18]